MTHRHLSEKELVLLNGPAGVGKTTVSRSLAAKLDGTVCISGDDLRAFAPSDARSIFGPGSTYRVGAALAEAYFGMGARRVIFEYVFESARQVEYFRNGVPTERQLHLVTLWAPWDLLIVRAATGRERHNLAEDQIRKCHAAITANRSQLGWILDTTSTSADNAARAIHERLLTGGFPWSPADTAAHQAPEPVERGTRS